MNKLIRIWNQNRGKIIITALVVVFFFIIIRALNSVAKKSIEQKNNNTNTAWVEKEQIPDKSILTGQKVNTETTKTNVSVIEEFVNSCNENNIDKAYNLLTDDCKETLFKTKEKFIENYYNLIFTEGRTTKIENYKNSSKTNTYKVTFYGDVLGSGDASAKNSKKDYITVEKQSGKLNINSLITTNDINKKTEQNGIIVTVAKQEIYIDYEIYIINVKNNTNKEICMDTKKSTKSVYGVRIR